MRRRGAPAALRANMRLALVGVMVATAALVSAWDEESAGEAVLAGGAGDAGSEEGQLAFVRPLRSKDDKHLLEIIPYPSRAPSRARGRAPRPALDSHGEPRKKQQYSHVIELTTPIKKNKKRNRKVPLAFILGADSSEEEYSGQKRKSKHKYEIPIRKKPSSSLKRNKIPRILIDESAALQMGSQEWASRWDRDESDDVNVNDWLAEDDETASSDVTKDVSSSVSDGNEQDGGANDSGVQSLELLTESEQEGSEDKRHSDEPPPNYVSDEIRAFNSLNYESAESGPLTSHSSEQFALQEQEPSVSALGDSSSEEIDDVMPMQDDDNHLGDGDVDIDLAPLLNASEIEGNSVEARHNVLYYSNLLINEESLAPEPLTALQNSATLQPALSSAPAMAPAAAAPASASASASSLAPAVEHASPSPPEPSPTSSAAPTLESSPSPTPAPNPSSPSPIPSSNHIKHDLRKTYKLLFLFNK